ncbi:MMPL family transporter [Lachnospira multipara]|uniref:Membrane transport protein MMPL domain-containing protein n=1 Tax=Lachnospira multipara TaxID=28051 RepID=A0A1H5TT27_9FIRM|nr:MMPL family transporter [Lachnospira multipara]SEF65936.1 hypothetical protein SAMN05216537_105107 [Lachnospira multipara]
MLIPSFKLQSKNTFIYGSAEPTKESRLGVDSKKIEDVFGKSNMVVILVPRGNEEAESKLAEEFKNLDYVESVMSYANVIGFDVPMEYLPEGTADKFYSENYARIILSTSLETESKESFRAVEQIKDMVSQYYSEDETYMCGNSVNLYDMKECIEADNKRVSLITLIAIAIILIAEFKSLIIPLILILVVKGSIWITLSMSAISGEAICYIGYLVVSTVMMGATIDYSILISDEYIKNRKSLLPLEAMKNSLKIRVDANLLGVFSIIFLLVDPCCRVFRFILKLRYEYNKN